MLTQSRIIHKVLVYFVAISGNTRDYALKTFKEEHSERLHTYNHHRSTPKDYIHTTTIGALRKTKHIKPPHEHSERLHTYNHHRSTPKDYTHTTTIGALRKTKHIKPPQEHSERLHTYNHYRSTPKD
jgi:predicted DNA-binding protein